MQSTRYIVTSCHGNDDEMWSTSCLIMQHKPYVVELSFMETQESNDSINEGPSITMEGPSQTNAVLEPLYDVSCRNHQTEFKSDVKLYRCLLPIPVICLIAWHSYTYSEEHPSTLDHSLCNECSHMYLLYLPLHLHYEITLC